jgi:hypothetical protein
MYKLPFSYHVQLSFYIIHLQRQISGLSKHTYPFLHTLSKIQDYQATSLPALLSEVSIKSSSLRLGIFPSSKFNLSASFQAEHAATSMCAHDIIWYVCGHHFEVAGIRKCALTLASENFKPCSIPGEWPIYVHQSCTACSRVEWNNDILEKEKEHRSYHELGECACSELYTEEERQRSRSVDRQKGKQIAREAPPQHHHEGASQNIHETASANKEQQRVVNEPQTKMEIQGDSTYWERVAEVFDEPSVETDTQQALSHGNLVRMIQLGDMEPTPYYPEQHSTTAVRSEYTTTGISVGVSWEFNLYSDTSSTSAAVESLSYASQQRALLAELPTGELQQPHELDKDAIYYTPIAINNPMSRARSKSCPPIFSHEGSMLHVLEE